jgi:hypothetical protein
LLCLLFIVAVVGELAGNYGKVIPFYIGINATTWAFNASVGRTVRFPARWIAQETQPTHIVTGIAHGGRIFESFSTREMPL